MNIVNNLLKDVKIPQVLMVEYSIYNKSVDSIEKELKRCLKRSGTIDRIKCNDHVAIGVGSREISNIFLITKYLVEAIKEKGAYPFIVPSMGSHGGSTAEGQKKVLSKYGITEENIGIPIKSSMETVRVGFTSRGLPVEIDRYAFEADCIIPVGRIKPHTDFRGKYESGIMKMITIGLGKQKGASICHGLGMENMTKNIADIAEYAILKTNIIFGLGIIENSIHQTFKMEAIPSEAIAEEEPALLETARKMMPLVPYDNLDVLVVMEMGKDISGTGMDTNIIGRSSVLGKFKPNANKIVVLNLTDKSNGNANGMGLSDITTKRLYEKINLEDTYSNIITTSETDVAKIPIIMADDATAIKCGIGTCRNPLNPKIVIIKNTLRMNRFYFSENLLDETVKNSSLKIIKSVSELEFDKNGNLINLF